MRELTGLRTRRSQRWRWRSSMRPRRSSRRTRSRCGGPPPASHIHGACATAAQRGLSQQRMPGARASAPTGAAPPCSACRACPELCHPHLQRSLACQPLRDATGRPAADPRQRGCSRRRADQARLQAGHRRHRQPPRPVGPAPGGPCFARAGVPAHASPALPSPVSCSFRSGCSDCLHSRFAVSSFAVSRFAVSRFAVWLRLPMPCLGGMVKHMIVCLTTASGLTSVPVTGVF
jgi:hypothetical protein